MVFTEPQPATTVAPTLVEGNDFPAWSIALLAIAAILSFCLCACCACLYLSTNHGVQRSKGIFHYQQPLQRTGQSVPVRNRLIQAKREVREVPCRNPLCDIDDDEFSRLEARDQKKMQQLSDILNHADFLNVCYFISWRCYYLVVDFAESSRLINYTLLFIFVSFSVN